MVDIVPSSRGPVTAEGFIADRQRFWTSFTRFVTYAAGVVVLILILMAFFLT